MRSDEPHAALSWGWWLGAVVAVLVVVAVWTGLALEQGDDAVNGNDQAAVVGGAPSTVVRLSTTPVAVPATSGVRMTAAPTAATPTASPTVIGRITADVQSAPSGLPPDAGPTVTLHGTLVALEDSTHPLRNCLGLDTGGETLELAQTDTSYSIVFAYDQSGTIQPRRSGIMTGSVETGTDEVVATLGSSVALVGARSGTVTSGCGTHGGFDFRALT